MTASIPAAKERLTKLRDELTRRSSYVNHIPSARERDAGNAAAIDAGRAALQNKDESR